MPALVVTAPRAEVVEPDVHVGATLGVRLAFAAGTTGFTAIIAATSFFLMFFLTDVALLPPALVANGMLVAKLWDTVNDPLTGWLLDRTRHRVALRTWLLVGAVPLTVTAAAIWWFPPGLSIMGRLWWVTGAYLVFDTALTLVTLAFNALSAEATSRYDDRTRFMAFTAVGGVLGYLVGASSIRLASKLVTLPVDAHLIGGAVIGLLAGGGVLLTALVVREKPVKAMPVSRAPTRFLDVLRQRPFWLLVAPMSLTRMGFTIVSVSLPYFAKYYLGNEGLAVTLVLLLMGVVALFVPLWRRLAEAWGKAPAYAASLAIVAAVLALTWALPRGSASSGVFIVVGLLGIGMAGHWVLPWAIVPDLIDCDEAQYGERRVGTYFGLFGLADKLARTISFVSVGWVLGASGFVANAEQAPNAIWAIRALFGPGSALLVLAAVPLLLRFPIDRAVHARARARLDASMGAPMPTPIRPGLVRRLFTQFALSMFKVPRDAVRFGLKRFSTRTAIVAGDRRLTFGQLKDRVGRLVGAMQHLGVGKGSVVLMALDDGPELIELRYAAMEAGVIVTSVAPWATAAQVELLRQLGEPAMVFFDARLPPSLKAALRKLPMPDERRIETGAPWEALLAAHPPRSGPKHLLPGDVAGLGFTSGTTGEPKVLAMPQGALLKSLALTAMNVGTPVGTHEVMLSAIPLNGAGSGLVLPLALTGATLVIAASLRPDALVETMRSQRVTRAFVTPSQLLDLLDEPGFTREQLPHLRNIIYGTAAMPVPRLEEAIERMGPIFQQGYGMAEVLPPVSLLQMEHHQIDGKLPSREVLRSVGWVVPQVHVRVVNAQLEDVPAGQVGEVLVKSPTVFEGYWRLGGVDRTVFHQGYLRTGDFGLLTEDRRLTVLDRRPDLLHRDGRVLYPRLLEEVAYGEPEVKEACLVQGAPESPLVLVVSPRHGRIIDVESLRRRYERQLDPAERPDEIRVMRALPRSHLQKLLRREVRSLLAFA